jgi:integrase
LTEHSRVSRSQLYCAGTGHPGASPLDVKLDRRHDRRNLEPTELHALLKAAVAELARLTPESFLLDCPLPTINVQPGYTKNRKEVSQPLPPDLAGALRGYLIGKLPDEPVWSSYWSERAAEMLKVDLEAAGVAYVVDGPSGPLFADFHALRHSYGTLMERSGVSPRQRKWIRGEIIHLHNWPGAS